VRFSTKILLLTLAITVGLGAVVVIVVRGQITAREISRARAAIDASADIYFERLEARQREAAAVVRLLLEDPNNKAWLDQIAPDATAEDRKNAQEQFKYTFGTVLQTELQNESDAPAFHALVNATGRTLVATAGENVAFETALVSKPVNWAIADVLGSPTNVRQYLLIEGGLYLAFGVPLRQTRDEAPNFAYFCGFSVTNDWLNRLLGTEHDEAAVTTWFIVDGKLVASGTNRPTQLGSRGERIIAALAGRTHADRIVRRESIPLELDGERLVAQYSTFNPAPGVQGVLVVASSLNEQLQPLRTLLRGIAIVTGVVAVLAVVAAGWLARHVARPVEQLVAGTQRIAQGDFTHTINIQRNDELGELARSFNEMAVGLAQRDLIKDTLGQFVDPRIADALLTNPASLRGQRLVQSVLFSDIEKFTSLSEKLPPEQLVQMLNRFLGASADVVKGLNGYLDKFLGDGVVAFWGPPVEKDHSIAACRAGLKMIELSRQFQDPPLRVRIGVATGEVLVGIVGSESSKKNYTAMGDVVNLASRLEGANKVYCTQILVDARTAAEVSGVLVTRKIDVVRVVGRAEPVELYEVLGESAAIDGTTRIERYERATMLYKSRRWSDAREAFAAIGDAPSRVMSNRCESLIRTQPAGDWDGVWNLDVK
jgi:class 3 adenylate cyclase